jgi:hypothetical protein
MIAVPVAPDMRVAVLGHANISTKSGYLHARPRSSSGLKLDRGVFHNADG